MQIVTAALNRIAFIEYHIYILSTSYPARPLRCRANSTTSLDRLPEPQWNILESTAMQDKFVATRVTAGASIAVHAAAVHTLGRVNRCRGLPHERAEEGFEGRVHPRGGVVLHPLRILPTVHKLPLRRRPPLHACLPRPATPTRCPGHSSAAWAPQGCELHRAQ